MRFDYIIVGAGSAGCVLANRLSQSGKHSVLLLEAGQAPNNLFLRIPLLGSLMTVGKAKYDWLYKTQADPTRDGRIERMPRGKVVGGSSQLNAMISLRGSEADYDHWAQLGNKGWSWTDIAPYFVPFEAKKQDNGVRTFVKQMHGSHPLTDAFLSAMNDAGIKNTDVSTADIQSSGYLNLTSSGRARLSASDFYLTPALSRANLRVRPQSNVLKIVFKNKTAIGVEIKTKNGIETVYAEKEIVLSGGSINSPHLLMLSGVGPVEDLRGVGIDPIIDLPGVGQNLHDHPAVYLQARTKRASYNSVVRSPTVLQQVFEWAVHGRGMFTAVMFEALAFIKTHERLDAPDAQLHFAPCGYRNTNNSVEPIHEDSFTIQANVNRPRSRGYVKLASANADVAPEIQPNMFGDSHDLSVLRDAAKWVHDFMHSSSMKQFIEKVSVPVKEPKTNKDWEDFIRQNSQSAYHPVGTCKMGLDQMAVVSPDLKVIGVEKLRVVDGSVLPQLISANTQATIMMIAEKAADMILAGR